MKTTGQRAARRIMDVLKSAGAHAIFGYPGESTLPLYAESSPDMSISRVMAQCERCAGYMADGFARTSGTVGFCDAPGGVGTPFLVPALHEAFTSGIPLVAMVTSAPDEMVGRWPTTHIDHQQLFASIAKEIIPLRIPERIEESIDRAIYLAGSGRPGPVVVDIEPGLLHDSRGEPQQLRAAHASVRVGRTVARPARDAVSAAGSLLRRSQRPLLVLGGGVHWARAYPAIEQFARLSGVPIATTFNGIGAISAEHPNSIGVIGAKGSFFANEVAARADVVIWCASKAGDKSTQYGRIPSPHASVIQVDVDPSALGRTFATAVEATADAGAFLEDLAESPLLEGWRAPGWVPTAKHVLPPRTGLSGAFIASTLRERTRPTISIVADASRVSSWLGAYDRPVEPGRRTWAPRGSGSLGYAVPAAIGAAIATSQPAIALVGDGGFSMSCHELITAVRVGVDLAVVVIADGKLGLLEAVGQHIHGADFRLPGGPTADWAQAAKAFGARGVTVDTIDSFEDEMSRWSDRGGVTVIEARVSAGEVSPDLQMFIDGGARRW